MNSGVTEQDLTNALIKLNAVGEQKVYFITGHGEWPLEPSQPRDPASLSELRKTLLQEGYLPRNPQPLRRARRSRGTPRWW